jgi:hypothetical protein
MLDKYTIFYKSVRFKKKIEITVTGIRHAHHVVPSIR